MKERHRLLIAALALVIVFSGCQDRGRRGDSAGANSGGSSARPATDEWLGQWSGPEGTFLRLEGGQGQYQITIQDLDGPRHYKGSAAGDRIRFDRNGEEYIRATGGAETGMKWLRDKSDCLTIRPGEGYCRD